MAVMSYNLIFFYYHAFLKKIRAKKQFQQNVIYLAMGA